MAMSTIPVMTVDTFNLFPASPLNHVILFSNLPYTSFLIQEVNLPGITTNPQRTSIPGLTAHFASDRLTYDPLLISFLVDDKYRVHRELQRWMVGVTGREDRSKLTLEYLEGQNDFRLEWGDNDPAVRLAHNARVDAGLTIVDNMKNPILRVLFYDVVITNLGGVQLNTTATDTIAPLVSTAAFEYDFYSFVEIR